MDKISGVVITYNEEKNIYACLDSLSKVCDEIIVVDSFSTDKTEQICKQFTNKFYTHKFEGYRDQKNYALKFTSNNFILSLDADEILENKLIEIILNLKKSGLKFDAYKFNRLNHIGKKSIRYGDWYPDSKIRLWNKNKGQWAGKNVHETVKMQDDATIMHIKSNILHYPYKNISEFNIQHIKFAEMWANDAAAENKKSSILLAILKSAFKFVKGYFLKLGFCDGFYGLAIQKSLAHYTFMKYARLLEINKQKKEHPK